MVLLLAGAAFAQSDADGDGVPDSGDNCARAYNPDQEDADEDSVGGSGAGDEPRDADAVAASRGAGRMASART